MADYYLAIDIGASSGRHILGTVEKGRVVLEEVYRFENGMDEKNGHLCWNTEYLFGEIVSGMKKCAEIGKIPKSVGIDTWGVDYVLLDKAGKKLGEAVGYRDHRTDHIMEERDRLISSEELYGRTGIQDQPYNTINQLLAWKKESPEEAERAACMLMTPDYYNYCLTGVKKQEYTIASTSQLLDIAADDWDEGLLERLGLKRELFLPIEQPGTEVGSLKPEIAEKIGYDCRVILTASHDTASAVMAVPSLEENTLYISSGTWSLMGIESRESNCLSESRKQGFTNEGGYQFRYRYLKNIMGLWMIQSIRKEAAPEKSFAWICEEASKAQITSVVDCNDTRFLSPGSMVQQVQQACKESGQTIPKTVAELASVVYRSLAVCYGKTKTQIENLTGKKFDRLYVIGGGSKADYLNRLTGNEAGCTVSAGPAEATAIGNLLAQMISAKEFKNLTEARKAVMESFEVIMYNKDS